MNHRQRFNATMHYQPFDRGIISDFGFWDETLVVWKTQGLPNTIHPGNSDEFFGMDFGLDRVMSSTKINVGLQPLFDEIVLEDRGELEIIQQSNGVWVRRQKFMCSIPKHLKHTLIDRESWDKFYKPRLDPENPDRFPSDLEERLRSWRIPDREDILVLPGGSLYGWLRDWMGLENLSLVIYDDPAWFEEMVTTLADCIISTLCRLLETGINFDACGIWEDMAYNAGPLLSPTHFKKYLVPHYRRLTEMLHKHGVDIIWVDCDGNIASLIPLWLDAGINCMFPLEVGTWGADPIEYRRQYGKDLRIMGGFNKRILAQSPKEIEREIYRLAELVEEGGFIGFCDHRVPPDVPLKNYWFYLETVRKVWAKNLDLAPMGRLNS